MNPNCDCGTCCDTCGHEAGCTPTLAAEDPGYDHDAYTL